MKNVIILLLVYIICAAVTCEPKERDNCHTAIRFSNNTDKKLYVRDVYISNPFDISRLSNTVFVSYVVNAGEQNNRRAISFAGCFEHDFERADTVFVYIFDASVIENTPWEVVARDYLVLKRYDLTLSDLQRLDWRVTYPPTEAMKDIKQYPTYGE